MPSPSCILPGLLSRPRRTPALLLCNLHRLMQWNYLNNYSRVNYCLLAYLIKANLILLAVVGQILFFLYIVYLIQSVSLPYICLSPASKFDSCQTRRKIMQQQICPKREKRARQRQNFRPAPIREDRLYFFAVICKVRNNVASENIFVAAVFSMLV